MAPGNRRLEISGADPQPHGRVPPFSEHLLGNGLPFCRGTVSVPHGLHVLSSVRAPGAVQAQGQKPGEYVSFHED